MFWLVLMVGINGFQLMEYLLVLKWCSATSLGAVYLGHMFVNDMLKAVHWCFQMFAYDTKFYWDMCSAPYQHYLQADLDDLEWWSDEWLLRFIADECNGLLDVVSRYQPHIYKISKEGQTINLQVTKLEKDLGMHIDLLLNFSGHCKKQVNKEIRFLGLIRTSYG